MSLFSVVQEVMDANGWPAPTLAVATSQDQNMRQCMALVNGVLESTSYKKNWPALVKDYSFMSGSGMIPLPDDFHHLCIMSAYNKGQYVQMKGSMTPAQWYRAMFAGMGNTWFDSFRIVPLNKTFQIFPVPSAPEELVFMYVTSNLAKQPSGTPIPRYVADDDTAVIDEYLIKMGLSWRWRQKKGLDFTAELAEYQGTLREKFAQYLATGEIPVGGPRSCDPLTEPRVPWPVGV